MGYDFIYLPWVSQFEAFQVPIVAWSLLEALLLEKKKVSNCAEVRSWEMTHSVAESVALATGHATLFFYIFEPKKHAAYDLIAPCNIKLHKTES